jgi:hypothetical protein
MEYGWKCFSGEGLKEMKTSGKCKITLYTLTLVLVMLLTLLVAGYDRTGGEYRAREQPRPQGCRFSG